MVIIYFITIFLGGKKIFVALIIVFLFFLGVAFGSGLGNPISNLNKSITVLQNDIITSEWYSAVNKRLGGAVSEGGFCKSIGGTINCLDTNTSGSENGWQEISLNNKDPFNRFCQYRTCDPKHINDSLAVVAQQIWVSPIDANFDYWLTHANDKSKAKHSKDLNNWVKLTNLSMKCD